MSDDRSTFEVTRARLEDIVVQVRRKDVSLEQSLDLLEEAVRLVNQCNDLIDQTSFRAVSAEGTAEAEGAEDTTDDAGAARAADAEDGAEAEFEGVEFAEVVVVDGDEAVAIDFVDLDLDGEDDTVMLITDIEDDERS
jgi:exodeoxyribonuclease VII small subunit